MASKTSDHSNGPGTRFRFTREKEPMTKLLQDRPPVASSESLTAAAVEAIWRDAYEAGYRDGLAALRQPGRTRRGRHGLHAVPATPGGT